jgi:ElaB/YqjD/DUF883 family membrane-anchored ribosome-binding protein
MHKLLMAAIAVGALFVAEPALAQGTNDNSFSGHFEQVDQELVNLEASLSDSSERADKKRLKAVRKARKAIAKEADDLGDDMKTASKVAKTLEKGFKDEFAALRTGEAAADLPDLLLELVDDLFSDLDELLLDLEESLAGLSDKGVTKVQKALDKASGTIETGDDQESLSKVAKLYFKAYKAWAKGQKTIDKDPGPTIDFTVKIDGKKQVNPVEVNVVFTSETGLLVVIVSNTDLGGYNISFTPEEVDGTGTYDISTASALLIDIPPDNYSGQSGSLTISTLDTEARRIAGSFQFTADGVGGTTGSVTVTGTFDISYVDGGV